MATLKAKKKPISPFRIFLMVILPFTSTLFELINNPKSKIFTISLCVLSIFIGLNGIVSFDTGTDYAGYIVNSINFKDVAWSQIFKEKDFFYPGISKVLSNISTNNYFISCCFVLMYYFLYLKSFNIIIKHYNNDKSFFNILLLLCMYLVIPFVYVNGFRFYIALLFFLWCTLEYILNSKRKFLFIILFTPFIHFSFFIFLPLLYFYIIMKNKLFFTIIIFFISFVISKVTIPENINRFSNAIFSESVSSNVSIYASKEGLESMNQKYEDIASISRISRAIYKGAFEVMNNVLMFIVIYIVIFKFKFITNNKLLVNYFVFIILTYSFANLAGSVSNGFRFYVFANTIFVFIFFYINSINTNWRSSLVKKLPLSKLIYGSLFSVIIIYAMMKIYFSATSFNILNIVVGNWITI